MTATRHIIGLGNWRWWAFMSKWETTHGAAAAHTYMYVCVPANYDEIWGNKIITSGFKLLLLLAHSTVCWWCSWRKYRWITPKRFLIFVCELDGRGVSPHPIFHHHLSKRTRICSSQLRFCEVRAPTLVNWLSSNPESKFCPKLQPYPNLSPHSSCWGDFLVHYAVNPPSRKETHALYYQIKLLPPLMMMMNDATWNNSSTHHRLISSETPCVRQEKSTETFCSS